MQTLFEWEFAGRDKKELEEVLSRNTEEFAPGAGDDVFMNNLLSGVVEKKEKLDDVITKAAPDWPLEKIANVDRNILRIGLYELLYGNREEVPPKVAINEAIELAKNFGGEASGKFVNGVLGSVYREIGEPGKDQQSKKKKDIPFEEMEIEKLGGAVVYSVHEDNFYLGFVHDIFGHWTLAKGHLEEGMDEKEAVKMEVEEEINVPIEVKDKLGENEYVSSHPEKIKIRKQVVYYLASAPHEELKLPEGKKGLDDVRWFPLDEIVNLNFYDDIYPIVTKAVNILLGKEE